MPLRPRNPLSWFSREYRVSGGRLFYVLTGCTVAETMLLALVSQWVPGWIVMVLLGTWVAVMFLIGPKAKKRAIDCFFDAAVEAVQKEHASFRVTPRDILMVPAVIAGYLLMFVLLGVGALALIIAFFQFYFAFWPITILGTAVWLGVRRWGGRR
jgi:hypothetical protein